LHDWRTTDLGAAIEAHADSEADEVTMINVEEFTANGAVYVPIVRAQSRGSEAQVVVNNYNALSASEQTDLLNFLRSL
jgi:hypothetical protein